MVVWSLWGAATTVVAQPTEPAKPEPLDLQTPWRGSAGIGLGVAFDLGDGSEAPTTLGPGVSLLVPLRFSVAPAASLRITPRFDAATGGGNDGTLTCASLAQLTWQVTPDERSGDADECGWLAAAGVTIGPEIRIPSNGAVQPYLAGGVGALGTVVFNRIDRAELVIYDTELTSVDGWSLAASLLTDVHLGLLVGRKTQWFAEAGYAVAWVPGTRLRRSVEVLDVRREPFGYNAVRASTGIAWTW